MNDRLELECLHGHEGQDLPCDKCWPECPSFPKTDPDSQISNTSQDEGQSLPSYLLFIR